MKKQAMIVEIDYGNAKIIDEGGNILDIEQHESCRLSE